MRFQRFLLDSARSSGIGRGAYGRSHPTCAGCFTRVCGELHTQKSTIRRAESHFRAWPDAAPEIIRSSSMASLPSQQSWPCAARRAGHACPGTRRTLRGMLRLAWELITRDRRDGWKGARRTLRGMLRLAWELITRDPRSGRLAARTSPRDGADGTVQSVAQGLLFGSSGQSPRESSFSADTVDPTAGSLSSSAGGRRPAIAPARRPAIAPARRPAIAPARRPAIAPARRPATSAWRQRVITSRVASGPARETSSSDSLFPSPQHSFHGRTASHFLARKEGL